MKKLVLFLPLLCSVLTSIAQDEIWMRPNKGQWHSNIRYNISIPGGHLFLENNGFTYAFTNDSEIYHHGHEHDHDGHEDEVHTPKSHAVKTTFIGANPSPKFEENLPAPFYENYFLTNDSTQWVRNNPAFNEIQYTDLYDSIDLRLYESQATLKYDVIIRPGGDPAAFKVAYEGQDAISLTQQGIEIITTLTTITEGQPYAYQVTDGIRKKVPCEYLLDGNQMTFTFPEGYDSTKNLIIDPELTFSTFTGASSDNWGMTACPDIDGKLIGGGIVFGSGYPLSAGPLDGSFNGGAVDIGLTKFTANGSSIVYSTFIGGTGSETPHSLIVNDANELYIMGATSSTDFPVGFTPYQATNNGGPSDVIDGIDFSGGADIFILKLSSSGTSILGGTYLGGNNFDGISEGGAASFTVAYNYGDQLRGEIILDDASNVYIASSTKSSNFPIVGGFDGTIGGTQDAVAAKLNSNLSALLWSTYIGGTGLESGNSVKVSSAGDIFVAGGTSSSNLPNTAGKVHSTYQGGSVDGYLMKFNAPTYAVAEATYLGTNDYDQAYFVELDVDDFVYVYGQSSGSYQTDGPNYINPNSGQFIHKMNNDLTSTEWSSVFGAGTGVAEISPTAFLVSDCYEIYIAGWGGNTNIAAGSTTSGFPTTADAYQTTTSGSNFYLAVFEPEMADLKYGTFMGNPALERDHVDGGTSRFDKSGTIYHAVCAACSGNDNGFPTTPGAFSPTNNSPNCNMAVFQFELSQIEASLGTGAPVICIPDPVVFENSSINGNTYFWDFGDGVGTSDDFEPTYFYSEPGDYTVMLIVSDINGCYTPDTAWVDVTIQLFEGEAGALMDTVCPGSPVQLYATGGDSYSWTPADLLDNPTDDEPIATITEATVFTVAIESVCGSTELEVPVFVYNVSANAGGDTAICVGGFADLYASGGETYAWFPPDDADDPSSATPSVSPPITTYYIVEITTEDGCVVSDTVKVHVDQDIPFPNLIDEVNICRGDSIRITAGGATDYLWEPDYNITDPTLYNPFVWPDVDTAYAVTFTNACGSSYDTVQVNVIVIEAEASPDTTICPGDSAQLWATGGEFYRWNPSSFLSDPNSSNPITTPGHDMNYVVTVTDEYGCFDTAHVNVYLFDRPAITVSPAAYPIVGDTVSIWADGDGSIVWSPPYNIECTTCPTTIVYPERETFYTATITDHNGCTNIAQVPIYFDPLIYVPNAFTPDGNDVNNYFKAIAHNLESFEMLIFNRWGELIYTMDDIDDYWDGSYQGSLVLDDVYVWQITYTDLKSTEHVLRGHVVLLK